jgi:Mrp family chromosome partitioning ATPase
MDSPGLAVETSQSSIYDTLLYTVFQQPREASGSGSVIALSSANRGEGVTYITRALVRELGRSDFMSVAGINLRFLRKLHEPTLDALRKSLSGSAPMQKDRAAQDGASASSFVRVEKYGPWEGSWQYRRDCINLLRSEFDHTILDCPSLRESGDLLSVAPFVDGVILVIEANQTRRDQLWQAEQSISAARGKLLGYILNKRTYEVPKWLYKIL